MSPRNVCITVTCILYIMNYFVIICKPVWITKGVKIFVDFFRYFYRHF